MELSIQANTLDQRFDYDTIRRQIREFVETDIKPRAETIDREGAFPRENLLALAEAGWNSVLIPEQWGGQGLDHVASPLLRKKSQKGVRQRHLYM